MSITDPTPKAELDEHVLEWRKDGALICDLAFLNLPGKTE